MPIELKIPSSKSISNRALIVAALRKGRTIIDDPAPCDDTDYMIKGLATLGLKISQSPGRVIIDSSTGFGSEPEVEIYTGNAGTTTRFLTALSPLTKKKITISGDERMEERPINVLTDALNQLGAKVETPTGCPPVTIHPQALEGGHIKVAGDISSQYISALLMAAPFAKSPATIEIEGPLCSIPYVDITLRILDTYGIKYENQDHQKFIIQPQTPPQNEKGFRVEGDASSASYIGGYSAIHPTKPTLLNNIYPTSIQGDIVFLDHLKTMGCDIQPSQQGTLITGPDKLEPLGTVDMNRCPDLVMTFAVLAMFAPGSSKFTNIANLRIKETDRITALKNELSKFPIQVVEGPDFLEVIGDPTLLDKLTDSPIKIATYNDHRMAMCFGMIRDLVPQLEIENPACVSKSYASFWDHLKILEDAPSEN